MRQKLQLLQLEKKTVGRLLLCHERFRLPCRNNPQLNEKLLRLLKAMRKSSHVCTGSTQQ